MKIMGLKMIWLDEKRDNFSFSDIKKFFDRSRLLLKAGEKKGKAIFFDPFLRALFLMDKECYEKYGREKVGKINLSELYQETKAKNKFIVFYPTITTDCNLRCIYCFAFGGENTSTYASWKILKLAIDYLAKINKEISISLTIGGEPTLNLPLLIKTIRYIKEKLNQEKISEISINGVISEKESLSLVDHFKFFQISCDGPPEIQDLQRPFVWGGRSSKYVENTIKALVQHRKHFHTATTITPYSLGKEKRIFKYFYQLNVPVMTFRILAPIGRGEKFWKNLPSKTLVKMIRSLFKFKEWGDYFDQEVKIPPEIRFLKHRMFRSCMIGHQFALSPDGKIFACPHLIGDKTFEQGKCARDFVIGRVDLRKNKVLIYENRRQKFSHFYKKVKRCKSCDLKFCLGGCPVSNYQKNGSIYLPDPQLCFRRKIEFRFLMQYWANKYFFKLKPRLELYGKMLFLNFLHSRFQLSSTDGREIRGNPFLKLNLNKVDYSNLAKKILNWNKKNEGKMKILLISPEQKSKLTSLQFKALRDFLLFLKENRIIFKITKPILISERIFEKDTNLIEKFSLPLNCFECQEMFVLKNGKILFCNKVFGPKINKVFSKEEIYQLFEKSIETHPPECGFFKLTYEKRS